MCRLVVQCVVVLRLFLQGGAGFVALVRVGLIVHGRLVLLLPGTQLG